MAQVCPGNETSYKFHRSAGADKITYSIFYPRNSLQPTQLRQPARAAFLQLLFRPPSFLPPTESDKYKQKEDSFQVSQIKSVAGICQGHADDDFIFTFLESSPLTKSLNMPAGGLTGKNG
jgi:hypothetical protein